MATDANKRPIPPYFAPRSNVAPTGGFRVPKGSQVVFLLLLTHGMMVLGSLLLSWSTDALPHALNFSPCPEEKEEAARFFSRTCNCHTTWQPLHTCILPPSTPPPPAGVSHPKPLNQGAVHELAAQKDMLVAESEAYQIGKPQASSFVYCAMPTTLFLLFCLAFQSLIVLNTCINRQHKVKPYRPIKLARMQVYFY